MSNTTDYETKKEQYYKALNDFVDVVLIPALKQSLDRVFNPPFDFKQRGTRWESTNVDINGAAVPGAVVYAYTDRERFCIGGGNNKSNANSTGVPVIELYRRLHPSTHYDTTVQELAKILNLSDCPTWEQYGVKQSEDAMRRRADKQRAAQILTEQLQTEQTEEAEKVRQYLHGRLTEEEYNEAVNSNYVGLASKDALRRVKSEAPTAWADYGINASIGTVHTIAIISPYGYNTAEAFIFRCLPEKEGTQFNGETVKKYQFFSKAKRDKLLGLEPTRDSVIIVEGEFDALKARLALRAANIKGVCVVSEGQNAINETRAANAVARGVSSFTIVPDNDKSGHATINKNIENLYNAGAKHVYVSELEGDAKDTAEYIHKYGVQKWVKDVRKNTICATEYQAVRLIYDFWEKLSDYDTEHEKRSKLIDDLEELATKPNRESNTAVCVAGVLRGTYSNQQFENFKEYLNYDPSTLVDLFNNRKYAEEEKRRKNALKTQISASKKLADNGKYTEAAKLAIQAATDFGKTATNRDEHIKLLTPPFTRAAIEDGYRNAPVGIPTNLYFLNYEGEAQQYVMRTGVTLICGARKHGKTTFLLNMILDIARRNYADYVSGNTDRLQKILLFTYEVTKRNVEQQLLSIYLNNKQYGSNSLRSIQAYYKGQPQFFARDPNGQPTVLDFENRKKYFFDELLTTGAITIIEENYKAEEMLAATEDFLRLNPGCVSFVAVDYIQELYSDTKYSTRVEELKQIGGAIRAFANKYELPFLCAAQFNRIEGILDVDTRNIGEAGDLERNAVDVIGIFNLKELRNARGYSNADYLEIDRLMRRWGVAETDYKYTEEIGKNKTPVHTLLGVPGKIYAKLLASRNESAPADVMLNFTGQTRHIDFNATRTTCEEAKQNKK